MKKLCICLLTSIAMVILMSSCTHKPYIHIGYVGDLTKTSSELGVNGRYGAELAIKRINEAGGIDGRLLTLVVKDDMSDRLQALQVDRELEEEGIKIIVGHMTSAMSELTVPYFNEKKLLMISPTISFEDLSEIDDMFLRVIPSNKYHAYRIADAMTQQGIIKAAVIYDIENFSFSNTIKRNFIERFTDNGGTVVLEESFRSSEQKDFSQWINQMDLGGTEAVFLIAPSGKAADFLQTRAKIGNETQVFLSMWSATSDLLKRAGPTAEGVYVISSFDNDSSDKIYTDFRDDYYEMFGSEPTFVSAFSYEAVMVIAQALRTTNSEDVQAIKDAIISQSRFNGLQYDIEFDAYGDVNREIFLQRVIGGRFVQTQGGINEKKTQSN